LPGSADSLDLPGPGLAALRAPDIRFFAAIV